MLSKRPRSPRRKPANLPLAVGLFACSTCLPACGDAGAGRGEGGSFGDQAERWQTSIGVTEEAVSDPTLDLTQVTGLDVDSQGRIYVGDWYQQKVTVLGQDARVLRTFGRRGSGPGEYRSIRGLQILPGDSLLVYDPTLARVSVYAPEADHPAYVTNLAAQLPGTEPFHLWRTRANDGFVALFRPFFMFMEGADQPPRNDVVRVLEPNGALRGDRLLTFPSRSFLVASTSVMPNPFGREGLVRTDSRDRLHFLWNDSLRVATLALSGEREGGFTLPFAAPPVTSRDIGLELEAMSQQGRATFQRVLRDSVSDRWPAVREMLVDDADRIWVALSGTRGEPTEWAVLSPAGGFVASVLVPSGVRVRLVRAGKLYGDRADEDGSPQVVVLRLDRLV